MSAIGKIFGRIGLEFAAGSVGAVSGYSAVTFAFQFGGVDSCKMPAELLGFLLGTPFGCTMFLTAFSWAFFKKTGSAATGIVLSFAAIGGALAIIIATGEMELIQQPWLAFPAFGAGITLIYELLTLKSNEGSNQNIAKNEPMGANPLKLKLIIIETTVGFLFSFIGFFAVAAITMALPFESGSCKTPGFVGFVFGAPLFCVMSICIADVLIMKRRWSVIGCVLSFFVCFSGMFQCLSHLAGNLQALVLAATLSLSAAVIYSSFASRRKI